jgi:hypothetical protein
VLISGSSDNPAATKQERAAAPIQEATSHECGEEMGAGFDLRGQILLANQQAKACDQAPVGEP